MRHPLDGVNAKVRRAEKHLKDLDADIRNWMKRNSDGVRRKFNPKTRKGVIYAFVPYKLRIAWGLHVGDVVHNTRSALDHLVYQLVVTSGGSPRGKTSFPIYLDHADYDEPQGRAALRGVPSSAVAIIKSLYPKGRDDPLFILKRLDNADKHRLVNVAAAITQVQQGSLGQPGIPGGQVIERFYLKQSSVVLDGIEDGADLAVYELGGRTPDVTVQVTSSTEVAFAKSGPGKGHPVVPLLTELIKYVETGVIPLFGLDKIDAKVPIWRQPG